MPLEADDQKRVDDAIREVGADPSGTKVLVLNAAESQKLGAFTVACTILNRTIGSGIFVSPAIVLKTTGSVGISLLLWALGSVKGMAALFVWLELGLSVPKFELLNRAETGANRQGEESLQCVPRNGGEKNYLEYIFKSKKMRTTCMFGVIYIVLGNLAGNAMVFGIYVMHAAGIEGHDSTIRGLAVVALTTACLLHASWRKGGIVLNNILAVLKALILIAIVVIGFAASAGASFGHGPVHGQTINPTTHKATSNFDPHSSFAFARDDPAGYASSLLFVVYCYSGYEQPFYVLGEVYRPKKYFAKTTIAAQSFLIILFMLVNIAYLCVVSADQRIDNSLDMATVFFTNVFGNDTAPRVMSGIIALSIFGNIVIMTFTASRVKQEVAKEGVLPFSLFFASNVTTPWIRLKRRIWPSKSPKSEEEQSPAAALFLHWIFAMVLIAATSPLVPRLAYTYLVPLYSYTVVLLFAFFVSSGLLYLRWFSDERHTWVATSGFRPLGGPTAAIIYTIISVYLLAALWIPPTSGSPFSKERSGVDWYIVPTVGCGMLVLGLLYYLVFKHVYPRYFKDGKVLVVDREAVIVHEDGEYVQALEIVDASWEARSGPGSNWDATNAGMQTVNVVAK